MRVVTLISVAVLATAGCSSMRVVNTGDDPPPAATSTSAAPQLPNTDGAHLVNAFDYVAHPDEQAAYYFTSPSGRWQCGILPRDKAGCQSTAGALSITGAPDTVPNAAGEETTPNAVVVEPEGEAHFAALDEPGFSLAGGDATVLPLNRTLIVARFRCNIREETGVSCASERGFTFSAEGFLPEYSEVPVDAQ